MLKVPAAFEPALGPLSNAVSHTSHVCIIMVWSGSYQNVSNSGWID